jgi:hypothetical protein
MRNEPMYDALAAEYLANDGFGIDQDPPMPEPVVEPTPPRPRVRKPRSRPHVPPMSTMGSGTRKSNKSL